MSPDSTAFGISHTADFFESYVPTTKHNLYIVSNNEPKPMSAVIPVNKKKVYIIGSLTNPNIPEIGNKIREAGFEVFDDWFSPGPEADAFWKKYEDQRGRDYLSALNGAHAKHIFDFDFKNLASSDIVVLVLPCGKSGHMELGWSIGQGKEGHILLTPEVNRWDLMYRLADGIWTNTDELVNALIKGEKNVNK